MDSRGEVPAGGAETSSPDGDHVGADQVGADRQMTIGQRHWIRQQGHEQHGGLRSAGTAPFTRTPYTLT